jgi:hypothetical protein
MQRVLLQGRLEVLKGRPQISRLCGGNPQGNVAGGLLRIERVGDERYKTEDR